MAKIEIGTEYIYIPNKIELNMALIELEGMEFYAFHGHYEVEKVAGNRFLVNLKIKADLSHARQTDKLEDTLDYQKIISGGEGRDGFSLRFARTCGTENYRPDKI